MEINKFWEDTYQRNIKKMIGICYRYVTDSQIAEDLAHDSFMTAIQKSDTFKNKGHVDAWLRRITINTALQYLRDIKVKTKYQQEQIFQESISYEEIKDMQHDFTIQELLGAINKLPEHHKLVFNLYVVDGFSHKQIGDKLNISDGTSKSHLARARKKIKEYLSEKVDEKERRLSGFIFLISGTRINVDKLYKQTFKKFELSPTRNQVFSNINWSAYKLPIIKNNIVSVSNIAITSTCIAIAALITISYINHQHKKESLKLNCSNKTMYQQNSTNCKVYSAINESNKHESNNKIDSAIIIPNKTVVIKKQRIIKKKVFVKIKVKQ